MEIDWNDFKIILALTRQGSIAGAARVLGIDGPTVLRRLTVLEDAIGARLVLRGGKEFSWTAEGRAAKSAAETLEGTIAEATRNVRAVKRRASGLVRVSCPAGIPQLLESLLPTVRERHPALTIELVAEHRAVDLAKGEADIALRMFRPTEPEVLSRRAVEMGWSAYASKQYVADQGGLVSTDDLAKHRLVLYDEELHRMSGPRWIEDHRQPRHLFTRVDNAEAACQLIASGRGIGVVPCFMGDVHPDLMRILPHPVALNTCWIVSHQATRETARVRVVADALVGFFEAEARLFSGRKEQAGAMAPA